MQTITKAALTALLFLLISSAAFAISADQAIAIVSVQNNYILSGETPSVSNGMITYKGADYIIVAAQNNSTINAYIPIKNSTGEIASQDIEVQQLIKTAIIYSKMSQLNQSVAAADWPLSYSTKSYFYDLSNDFSSFTNSIITVQTELNKASGSAAKQLANDADTAQAMSDDLATESTKAAAQVEQGRVFEQDFLNKPDTNKASKYEDFYNAYFDETSTIKDKFTALDAKINLLSQGISALESDQITVDQKKSFLALLTLPQNTRRLSSFFGTTDQLRTEIEGVFNEAKNSSGFATTLASRKVRNTAWLAMYGHNDELIKLDTSFETLQAASNAVLSTDNAPQWTNQDAVDALKANWAAAQSRFNNAEYQKAIDFASKAQANVKQIIADGVIKTPDPTNDIITKVVIGLVVLVVVVFVLQNFVLKKKKPEDYDEPEYK